MKHSWALRALAVHVLVPALLVGKWLDQLWAVYNVLPMCPCEVLRSDFLVWRLPVRLPYL
jgi:hypothetical protein